MKVQVIAALAALALSATSCMTVKKTATTQSVETNVKSITLADADVKAKVTATTTWSWNPFKRDNYAMRKSNLIAETLLKHDADILLEPQFIIIKESFGERTITVSGFPAKYKNFRSATPADAPLLQKCNHGRNNGCNSDNDVIKIVNEYKHRR